MVSLYDAYEGAKSDGGFFDTWLTAPWDDAKESAWMVLRILPVIGNFVRFSEARIDNNEYKNRHNIDPNETENYRPWRLPSIDKQSDAFAGLYGRGVNFVSSNIERLYK